MDTELTSLENKLSQLVEFCRRLRDENHELRQQLATEKNQNKQLHEKINGAKTRLENLLNRIPEN
jgi:cell division protein ZapB